MFSYLSKLLPLFVYPTGLACVLLISVLILRKFERTRRLQTALIILALSVLWLGSTRWVSYALARSLEWRYLPPNSPPHAEVIVVLGGGTEPAEYPRQMVEVSSGGDRILYGGLLYQQGAAPYILLSGGKSLFVDENLTASSATDMASILAMLDIPADKVWIQNRSINTYEDALFTNELLDEKGINRIILVTSALHMPRSVALFEKQGFEVIPAPADFTVTQTGWDALYTTNFGAKVINLLPSASSLGLTTNALKEYFGMLIYSLRNWI